MIADDAKWRRTTAQAVTTAERGTAGRMYRLYGLTAEEIKIVEGAGGGK
jgi:hypothetical protein